MLTLVIAGSVFFAAAAARWYLNRTSRSDTVWGKGHVELTAVWNEEAAFSLRIPKPFLWVLSALALLLAWRERKRGSVSTGLVLGGGCANLHERLRHKRVYDYVRFPRAPGRLKGFVWNLADFAILAGALGLLFSRKKK